MKYPIDLYQTLESETDLLNLLHLVSGNVSSVSTTPNGIVVVPSSQDRDLKNYFSSFESFLLFLKTVKVEGKYQKEIETLKKRLRNLNFIVLYDLYNNLQTCKDKQETNYTFESNNVAIKANELAVNNNLGDAPEEICKFYKKIKNCKKSKKLEKEAKNIKPFL